MKKRNRKQKVTAMNLLMFSIAVRMRDKVCQLGGGTFELAAHHILRKSSYAGCKFDPDNGILLCRDCHAGKNGGPHGPRGEGPFMLWLAKHEPARHRVAMDAVEFQRAHGPATLRMDWYDSWSDMLAIDLDTGPWEDYIPPRAAKWTVAMLRTYMQGRE